MSLNIHRATNRMWRESWSIFLCQSKNIKDKLNINNGVSWNFLNYCNRRPAVVIDYNKTRHEFELRLNFHLTSMRGLKPQDQTQYTPLKLTYTALYNCRQQPYVLHRTVIKNRASARCMRWLISLAWIYSICKGRKARITKWKILANNGTRTHYPSIEMQVPSSSLAKVPIRSPPNLGGFS